MENFVCDLRASVRTLIKRPGFTVVVVLILAFGIATNTAIFSVVNGVLLRALPYRQDDRIVTVWQSAPKRGVEREEAAVVRREIDLAVIRGDAAVHDVAATLDADTARHLRVVRPQSLAGLDVIGEHTTVLGAAK